MLLLLLLLLALTSNINRLIKRDIGTIYGHVYRDI